jgi:sec-independent protein translocase protein TatA
MNVFGIGLPEMALIFVLALLVFGPKKLPEIGKTLGKTIRGFQDASKEFEQEFRRETEKLEQVVSEPMQATLEPPAQLSPAAEIPEATLVENPPVASPIESPVASPVQSPAESSAA